jgi:NitT/TauT family transport system substrate-binding protein
MRHFFGMARGTVLAVAALAGLAHAAVAQQARPLTPVRIVMHWDHQAQFAGFYVAADKGFYEREGLDVTIVRGGPDVRSAEMLANGQVSSAPPCSPGP